MPEFFSPIIVIKSPIPTVIAIFKLNGIALMSISRSFVNEIIVNKIPSITIAASPTSQEKPIERVTVYAKYAFNPIDGAIING